MAKTPAEAMRASDKALTPGPWRLSPCNVQPYTKGHGAVVMSGFAAIADELTFEDAKAIVNFRNALPALTAVLDAAVQLRRWAGSGDGSIRVTMDFDAALAALTEALDG